MLLMTERTSIEAFERGTGWALRPEGACRGEVCVPLEGITLGDGIDVAKLAEKMGMPIVRHSEKLAAVGPATLGGNVLATAESPELVLPDLDGNAFDLRSLRGQKVVLVAWSPY